MSYNYNSFVSIAAIPSYNVRWNFNSLISAFALAGSQEYAIYNYSSFVSSNLTPSSLVISSSSWSWGNIVSAIVVPNSSYVSSDLGIFDMDCYGDMNYGNEKAIFSVEESSGTLSNFIPSRISDCCSLISEQIQFRHDLGKIIRFSNFLKRNGINLAGELVQNKSLTFIPVNYSSVLGKWTGSLHYRGESPTRDGYAEIWNLSVEFYCDGDWKIGLKLSYFNDFENYSSRILLTYGSEIVCPVPNIFSNFSVLVNTLVPSSNVVINDENGILPDEINLQFSVPSVGNSVSYLYSLDRQLKSASSLLI